MRRGGSAPVAGGIATATDILGASALAFEFRADQGISIDGSDDVTAWADIAGHNDVVTKVNDPHYHAGQAGSMSLDLPAVEFDRTNSENLYKSGTLASLVAGDKPQFYMLIEATAFTSCHLINVDSSEHSVGMWTANGWTLKTCGDYALHTDGQDTDAHLITVTYDGADISGNIDEGTPVTTANTAVASAPAGMHIGSNQLGYNYLGGYVYWLFCARNTLSAPNHAALIAAMQAYQASGA